MPIKSPDAQKTIGEAAKEMGVEQHVLRFWETQFPTLKPVRRQNRRYYTPENMELLRRIADLLYAQKYTIKGALEEMKQDKPPKTPPPLNKEKLQYILAQLKQLRDLINAPNRS